jgi:DNA invertase Pin-like site-specific DNA recombinase
LSYVAETERDNIRQRQAEGIAVAKANGVKFGRPPKEKQKEFYQLKDQYKSGSISARKASKILGITHRTFIRWCND